MKTNIITYILHVAGIAIIVIGGLIALSIYHTTPTFIGADNRMFITLCIIGGSLVFGSLIIGFGELISDVKQINGKLDILTYYRAKDELDSKERPSC